MLVVICFQISIFAESYTPKIMSVFICTLLWFAFKLVSLQSHIHLHEVDGNDAASCDLLSN